MNGKKKQRKLGLLGISLFTITSILFVWYEWGGGRTAINYTEVLALSEDVYQGQTITAELFTTIPLDKESKNPKYLLDGSNLIGKEAVHYIPSLTPLIKEYFDEAAVVLNVGEVIAQIPSNWITSMPQTLRRNDKVFLYATDIPIEKGKQEQNIQYQRSTSSTNEISEEASEEQEQQEQQEEITTTIPKENMVQIYETYVAYVKDGNNNEVYSVSSENRKNASSSISSIEIVTTAEDFKQIEKKINEGSYLIIMYSDIFEEE